MNARARREAARKAKAREGYQRRKERAAIARELAREAQEQRRQDAAEHERAITPQDD